MDNFDGVAMGGLNQRREMQIRFKGSVIDDPLL